MKPWQRQRRVSFQDHSFQFPLVRSSIRSAGQDTSLRVCSVILRDWPPVGDVRVFAGGGGVFVGGGRVFDGGGRVVDGKLLFEAGELLIVAMSY